MTVETVMQVLAILVVAVRAFAHLCAFVLPSKVIADHWREEADKFDAGKGASERIGWLFKGVICAYAAMRLWS